MFMLNKWGTVYLQENVLSCEDKNVGLHMYYTVNIAVGNILEHKCLKLRKLMDIFKLNHQNCMERSDWIRRVFHSFRCTTIWNPVILT